MIEKISWPVKRTPKKLGPLPSNKDNVLGQTTFGTEKELISVILQMELDQLAERERDVHSTSASSKSILA